MRRWLALAALLLAAWAGAAAAAEPAGRLSAPESAGLLDRIASCPMDRAAACFSDVSSRTSADVRAYLQGVHPDYPESHADSVLDFSASNILETMDTVVLDRVAARHGPATLQTLYDAIARSALATLRDVYPEELIVVALDAGHGGKPGHRWDPGANGTEAEHNRAVAAAIEALAGTPGHERIVVRRIWNDELAEEFGLPPRLAKPTIDSVLTRQGRASMLAAEAAAWKRGHPTREGWIAVHELSVHFNAGAGGALVLHQGDTVQPDYAAPSRAFASRYLERALAELNATGLLPSPLRRWGGDGLHDDVMMYRPSYFTEEETRGVTLRYGALQGRGFLPRYVRTILEHHARR